MTEFPLTLGGGVLLAPPLTALGALGAMLGDCTPEVEREQPPAAPRPG